MKRVLTLLICLIAIGFAVGKIGGLIDLSSWRESFAAVGSPEPGAGSATSGGGYGDQKPSTECLSADDISHALRKFSSESESKINGARSLLLAKSGESGTCRGKIIAAVMKAMDRPDLDFTSDTDSYYLWLYGAQLLGDLKAEESLDLLISHLKLMNRASFSTSMNHQPALKGLIRMGPAAIPKLDEVLRNNHDSEMRFYAVYCIAMIGGPSAISSLREALGSESDECVRRSIRVSLDSFDDKGNIVDRMKWFSGLSCNQ